MALRIIIGLIIALPIVFFLGKWKGGNDCENRHKVTQLEKVVEVQKNHAKIDRKTPYSADRAAKFQWLRDNARQ